MAAAALSAGAALVSILNYTGARAAEALAASPPAAARAHRILLTPAADTATALGDSILLAMLVTDARGAALLDVEPGWISADPLVATVDASGTVVARSPGSTAVIVRVGALETRTRIVVDPRPTELRPGDTLLRVREGEQVAAEIEAADARGNTVSGADLHWSSVDSAVARVDAGGTVEGITPGRGAVVATLGELRAELPVEVVPVAASITVLDGDNQRAPAGSPLPLPVTAQVVSRTGRPIAGMEAAFLVRSAGGSVFSAVDTSDARGMVSTVWTVDAVPGRQQLALAVEGVALSPVVTAESDPVPANTRVSLVAEPAPGTAGEPLAEPVAVRVSDSLGAPVAGVPVAWSSPDGGEVVAEGARSDSLGVARARWRLGPRAGVQRLRVQVGNPRTMPVFAAAVRAGPGPAESLVTKAGGGQRATAGSTLARPLVLRAVDRSGNPVPGVLVAARADAGRLADTLLRTDSAGQASVRWTLGRGAGTQRASFGLVGRTTTPVEMTARASAGPAARLAFVAAPSKATAGRAPADSLVVELSDSYGNAVVGARVALVATSGAISPARGVTDRDGRVRARWVPGRKAGPVTLTATAGKLRATRRVTLRPAP